MIADHLGKDAELITLESSFRDDLGADSLDLVEMIMSMEEMFDIEISESEAESIRTVGDAIGFIKSHV
jgi:acyl carrier protein